MNAHGYFFCDRCDETSTGARCQGCNHEARFVATAPEAMANELAIEQEREFYPVSAARGAELFRRLREQLSE